LEPGWTYLSDLIGCTVFDGQREIGEIEDVQFGAGEAPLLVVRTQPEQGEKRSCRTRFLSPRRIWRSWIWSGGKSG
jgi:ribosomal 30S subunit maturation factor RimM